MTKIKAMIKPVPRLVATVQKVATAKQAEQALPDLLTIYRLAKI